MTTNYILARRQSESDNLYESPSTPTGNLNRGNPLASKITSVLSASYADSDIKDALKLLDTRGLENTAATRRKLRLDVQKEVIESNGDIIREFGHVAEQLRRIGRTIANLNYGCEEMKRHILTAHQEAAPLLEEASELMTQKNQVEAKQQLLKALNSHFIISDDDVSLLTSTAEPVNDEFFTILSRVKNIQKDCEILLGTENQHLGLEIMDKSSKNLNSAFQKLYRWIQREFKSLNLENPQLSSSIRRALRVLAERPSLFQNCLTFFADAREHILTDSFYTALTGTSATGEENPSIKPIELVAHDPLRYVGDMLAWTHSATVSEKEALEVLFISDGEELAKGIQAGRDSEPWNRLPDEDGEVDHFDGLKALNELVDRNVTGVASILRQRIGQVIQSHEETIMAYKIANLLNFYRVTFSKLLGKDSVLLDSFLALEELALRQFRVLMKDHVDSLQAEAQLAPSDLGPPEFLQDALKQLAAIMMTYETSLSSLDSREADFQTVLDDSFDPFISGCEKIAKDLESPRDSIFAINYLSAARNTLSAFNFTKKKASDIQDSIQYYATVLIEYQHSFFQRKSGLSYLLEALNSVSGSKEDLKKIRTLDQFQVNTLTQTSEILDDFLPSAVIDAMENLTNLHNSNLAREITEEAASRFCDDFERVEEKLTAADAIRNEGAASETEGESLRALFPRTSSELRVLLS